MLSSIEYSNWGDDDIFQDPEFQNNVDEIVRSMDNNREYSQPGPDYRGSRGTRHQDDWRTLSPWGAASRPNATSTPSLPTGRRSTGSGPWSSPYDNRQSNRSRWNTNQASAMEVNSMGHSSDWPSSNNGSNNNETNPAVNGHSNIIIDCQLPTNGVATIRIANGSASLNGNPVGAASNRNPFVSRLDQLFESPQPIWLRDRRLIPGRRSLAREQGRYFVDIMSVQEHIWPIPRRPGSPSCEDIILETSDGRSIRFTCLYGLSRVRNGYRPFLDAELSGAWISSPEQPLISILGIEVPEGTLEHIVRELWGTGQQHNTVRV